MLRRRLREIAPPGQLHVRWLQNMRRPFPRCNLICSWCFALAVLPLMPSRTSAQKTCGGMRGRATSPQGWVIPKAIILLVDKSSKQTINVETDESGEYTICLSSGTYDVLASAMGYKRAKRKSIKVDASSKATIDFVLKQSGTVIVDRIHP
jgi:hypothetical protein